jgi:hypothetical protein
MLTPTLFQVLARVLPVMTLLASAVGMFLLIEFLSLLNCVGFTLLGPPPIRFFVFTSLVGHALGTPSLLLLLDVLSSPIDLP